MPILGKRSARRHLGLLVTAAVLFGAFGVAAAPAIDAQEPTSPTISITGRGWGHGRGMGLWGAFGYATGRSGGPWGYREILAHYYGNTQVGDVGNPLVAVTLLDQRDQPLVVDRAGGVTVDGLADSSIAVRVTLRSDGRYDVERGTSCTTESWSPPTVVVGPVRLQPATTAERADDVLQLCHTDGARTGYRGELVALPRAFDTSGADLARTVNLVSLDDFLRSVVPRQIPPAWASVDGGRGRQAILAQAVASRSYAAAGDGRWRDLHSGLGAAFTTCDTAACQLYDGVEAEHPVTDRAVADTTGEVRTRDATVMRTEYSTSSGGWTAGGEFPAVVDQGDLVRDNPHRFWAIEIQAVDIERRYDVGLLRAIHILERNGLGVDGGRVVRLRLIGEDSTVEVSGAAFRADFGLQSTWFAVAGAPPRAPIQPHTIGHACPPGAVPASSYTDVPKASVHREAIDCVTWWRVAHGVSATTFGPDHPVSRGQLASFVLRMILQAGGTAPTNPRDAFTDDDGTTHEGAINALASFSLLRGVGEGRFDPGAPVDRAQTAAVLTRLLAYLGVAIPSDPVDAFADDTGSFHEAAVNVVASFGIHTGAAAGYIEPDERPSRAQLATMLARTLDVLIEQVAVLPR